MKLIAFTKFEILGNYVILILNITVKCIKMENRKYFELDNREGMISRDVVDYLKYLAAMMCPSPLRMWSLRYRTLFKLPIKKLKLDSENGDDAMTQGVASISHQSYGMQDQGHLREQAPVGSQHQLPIRWEYI